MKKFALVLILVFTMAIGLAPSSHAVQLEEGWYAEFAYVWLMGSAYPDQYWESPWYATSAIGQFGPVTVAERYSRGRTVTIAETSDVASGTLFEDWGTYSSSGPYYDSIDLGWATNYDAQKLQLRIYTHRPGRSNDELLWSQLQSGAVVGGGPIWLSSTIQPGDDLVFRLVAIPEPSGLLALASGVLIAAGVIRRRTPR
ncbi:MAG: hypothetical protein KBC96_01585 [Armatimonadetes bacterium]|nr:hypothetical protein [Armatimonadota bacterium]